MGIVIDRFMGAMMMMMSAWRMVIDAVLYWLRENNHVRVLE